MEAPGFAEAAEVAKKIADAPDVTAPQAEVALVFDYASEWGWAIQSHGKGLSYFGLVFDFYRALRRLGLSVDIVPPRADALAGYKLILAPGLLTPDPALKAAFASSGAEVIVGPRFSARTADMATPVPLPPTVPGLATTVTRVESLRPGLEMLLKNGGHVTRFRDMLDGTAEVVEETMDGQAVMMRNGSLAYLGAWLDDDAMLRVLEGACARAKIEAERMAEGLRRRDTSTERFWFNYGRDPVDVAGHRLNPAGVLREPR